MTALLLTQNAPGHFYFRSLSVKYKPSLPKTLKGPYPCKDDRVSFVCPHFDDCALKKIACQAFLTYVTHGGIASWKHNKREPTDEYYARILSDGSLAYNNRLSIPLEQRAAA